MCLISGSAATGVHAGATLGPFGVTGYSLEREDFDRACTLWRPIATAPKIKLRGFEWPQPADSGVSFSEPRESDNPRVSNPRYKTDEEAAPNLWGTNTSNQRLSLDFL